MFYILNIGPTGDAIEDPADMRIVYSSFVLRHEPASHDAG